MKKLLSVILAGLMVLSMTACGGGTKVSLSYNSGYENSKTFGVEFTYPDNADIELYTEEDYAEINDNVEEYTFEIAIYEDDDYEYSENWAKESVADTYKEVEVLGYKGYSYSIVSEYTVILPFEEVEEGVFRYVELELQIDGDAEETEKFFNENKDIQSILKSMKYLGNIEE